MPITPRSEFQRRLPLGQGGCWPVLLYLFTLCPAGDPGLWAAYLLPQLPGSPYLCTDYSTNCTHPPCSHCFMGLFPSEERGERQPQGLVSELLYHCCLLLVPLHAPKRVHGVSRGATCGLSELQGVGEGTPPNQHFHVGRGGRWSPQSQTKPLNLPGLPARPWDLPGLARPGAAQSLPLSPRPSILHQPDSKGATCHLLISPQPQQGVGQGGRGREKPGRSSVTHG